MASPLKQTSRAIFLEQEIAEASRYATGVVATIREPLLVLGADLCVKSANRAFYKFFDVDAEEAIGKNIFELGKGQWDHTILKRLLQDILPKHTHFEDFEVEYRDLSDQQRTLLLNARQLQDSDGHPPMILLALEDVTEHKLLRERESAIRARDELLGVVSHELKNPLTAITTTLELINKDLPDDPQLAQSRRMLEMIRAAVERMSRIAASLLEAGRAEGGRLTLERSDVKVAECLSDVVALTNPKAQEKKIEMTLSVSPGELSVSCDRDRIFQVLLNLISNAIKFTNPGGRIEVLGCALDDRVQFRIKDTGRGIPSEEIPFVFERFWQSQHARANGVGLGLYIARGIVDAHGGRIWAESAVGKGTAIFFELPKSERN